MRVCGAGGDGWACDRSSDRYSLTNGLCRTHYTQRRRGKGLAPIDPDRASAEGRTCSFTGCVRVLSARGFCTGHYQQHSKGQGLTPLREKRGQGVVQEMVRRGSIECRSRGASKPASEYSLLNASGMPRPYCKPCNAERVRLNHYNLTRAFVDLLLEFQQGKCAVCRSAPTDRRAMRIDHDHACCPRPGSCGHCVRGLVCENCNIRGIAWYGALPIDLRTFGLLNDYLADPPAKRLVQADGRSESDVGRPLA
ncbi:endonuclease domain-containing protein [Streptomyces canus]|uniref:endonuclease domain-containing protein n=2 Tax=Streptomyces canus TaxID=58343 RepID=UPI00339001C5